MERKFKVGDKVIANDGAPYGITTDGWQGTVIDIDCDQIRVSDGLWNFWVKSRYFRLLKDKETIAIYRNGNVVTAVNKATKKVGIAKCNPSDKFDFTIGAKLAFERLVGSEESKKEPTMDKIKVGDMVEVVLVGKTYTTYTQWGGLCGYKSHYVIDKCPVYGGKYMVRYIGKHNVGGETLLLIQDMDTTQVFIIDIKGVKKC